MSSKTHFFYGLNFDFIGGLISLHIDLLEMLKNKNRNNKMDHKFVLFFIFSIVFWFMTKLSKEYDTTIEYPVSYINLVKDKLLQEAPTEMIKIHVKTTGFKLISATFFPSELKVDVSNLYRKSSTDYYLLLTQQKLAIQKQMKTGVEIDFFINDSIFLNLGKLRNKKVPVKPLLDFTYLTGFELNGDVTIIPDSIIISGPESILDTIDFVSTKLLQKNKLNQSINQTIDIDRYSSDVNLKFQQNNVKIIANVEKYTEGILEVPFEVFNLPKNNIINTFPKVVKVTYKVALSNFNKIDPNSFSIQCDYQVSQKNNLSYLIPNLVEKSPMVKYVRMSPMKIDYIINK